MSSRGGVGEEDRGADTGGGAEIGVTKASGGRGRAGGREGGGGWRDVFSLIMLYLKELNKYEL